MNNRYVTTLTEKSWSPLGARPCCTGAPPPLYSILSLLFFLSKIYVIHFIDYSYNAIYQAKQDTMTQWLTPDGFHPVWQEAYVYGDFLHSRFPLIFPLYLFIH